MTGPRRDKRVKRLLARLRRGEEGMTIAEVLVAALILVAGSLAVLNLVSASARNSFRTEQSQVVSNRLQSEMEQIQQLPFDQIALNGLPADSNNTNNPGWRVSGTSYSITQDGTQLRPLVYNGSSLYGGGTVSGGAVDPTPTHFTSGDVGGTIYRYVVWENDPSCPETTCPGSQDLKRVIVAIALDGTGSGGPASARHYQELQSQISNPQTSPVNDPNPGPACTGGADCQPDGTCTGTNCTGGITSPCTGGANCNFVLNPGGGDGSTTCIDSECVSGTPGSTTVCSGAACTYGDKPWTFWLTDTTCDNSARQPITADHLVHNTNGVCSSGLKNSTNCTTTLGVTTCTPGAPDMMVTNAPPLAGETPLYDYATDIEPATGGDTDKGLQMPPPSTNGCLSSLFQPLVNGVTGLLQAEDPSRMQTIHKWLSPPMGTGFNISLSGLGILNLWTQSINAASYTGKICVWLFERHLNALGVPVDTPAVNLHAGSATYFTYSRNPWFPSWAEIRIPMHFNLNLNLGPNSRLGLAIQVEKQGTSGGGMQFLYDEPSFDSRLQLYTSSPLPF